MNTEINVLKFAERFRALVEKNKTDIETLINVIGLKSKSTFYRYLNGQMAPKISTIKYLAEYYSVNPTWLMGYDVDKDISVDELGNTVVKIPVIGTVKAGYDYLAQENIIDTVALEKNIANSGEFFALKIHGDSMATAFLEDDIVIIKKQNDCENNQIAVVLVNGNEGTLKLIRKFDSGITLQPLNPAYEPKTYTNKQIEELPVKIIGVFYELRRKNKNFFKFFK